MEACNGYYYATRDPFGAAGDFTTAPEISQMFGEMVGACLADVWARAGEPSGAVYAELGPGRGTLAADALRVLRSGTFSGRVHLVETSPVLRQAQASSVADAQWHESIEELPDGLFDAGRERIPRCIADSADGSWNGAPHDDAGRRSRVRSRR